MGMRSFSSINVKLPSAETYLCEDLKPLPTKTTTNKEELLQYFRDMAYLRRIEIMSDSLYKQQLIRGFCHLGDGQEAYAVAMEDAFTKEDPLISAYRIHNQQVMRGDDHYGVIAEMMQKKTGSTGGKGGSMHYYNPDKGFYGGHGIVGAQIPMGTGLGFALKYKKMPNVSITMFGDGAANQG
jgi:pyruvate dehydrogenase E1 component alpha subunit